MNSHLTKDTLTLLALILAANFHQCAAQTFNKLDPQDNIQTIFTPYENGLAAYEAMLDRARKSVFIASYALSDNQIVDKLIELKTKRNVDIHLLLDLSQTQGRSSNAERISINALRQAGIEVTIGSSEMRHQPMHDKYTIVDDQWVESGSWNYSRSANFQNNVLDIIRSPKRAELFKSNWNRMYQIMRGQQTQREEFMFLKNIWSGLIAIVTTALLICIALIARKIIRSQRARKT